MNNNNNNNEIRSFEKEMLDVTRRFDLVDIFSDFLEIMICCLSAGEQEEHYFKIIKKYEKQELYNFQRAVAALINESDNRGEGLKDVLGTFFTIHVTRGHNGQYFTPPEICKLMAAIVSKSSPIYSELISDPACGSGTTLLAREEQRRLDGGSKDFYFGTDIDRRCAMMAAINLCINGMFGEISWMDTLSQQFFGAWTIQPHPKNGAPYIRKITEEESSVKLKLPKQKEKETINRIPEVVLQQIEQELPLEVLKKVEAVQQTLF
jgi:hypothetical protein